MEEQLDDIFQKPQQPKRPPFLTALCLLTFIASAMSGFTYFVFFSAYDEVMPQLQEFTSKFPGTEYILEAPKNFFITGFLLYTFSFFGANLMWRLKKVGFHFYTAAQIGLVLLPVIYFKNYPFVFDALFAALFIILYFRHYKLFN